MKYEDFINRELILFSLADNQRSIPSVMDGLKPSQRKVLFACFKRKLRADIKVAQLSGYISEHSAYHHGEASLASTIINLASDFVGSNNVNLLVPSGQFGTRLQGGKDHASPRYIFTRLQARAQLRAPLALSRALPALWLGRGNALRCAGVTSTDCVVPVRRSGRPSRGRCSRRRTTGC